MPGVEETPWSIRSRPGFLERDHVLFFPQIHRRVPSQSSYGTNYRIRHSSENRPAEAFERSPWNGEGEGDRDWEGGELEDPQGDRDWELRPRIRTRTSPPVLRGRSVFPHSGIDRLDAGREHGNVTQQGDEMQDEEQIGEEEERILREAIRRANSPTPDHTEDAAATLEAETLQTIQSPLNEDISNPENGRSQEEREEVDNRQADHRSEDLSSLHGVSLARFPTRVPESEQGDAFPPFFLDTIPPFELGDTFGPPFGQPQLQEEDQQGSFVSLTLPSLIEILTNPLIGGTTTATASSLLHPQTSLPVMVVQCVLDVFRHRLMLVKELLRRLEGVVSLMYQDHFTTLGVTASGGGGHPGPSVTGERDLLDADGNIMEESQDELPQERSSDPQAERNGTCFNQGENPRDTNQEPVSSGSQVRQDLASVPRNQNKIQDCSRIMGELSLVLSRLQTEAEELESLGEDSTRLHHQHEENEGEREAENVDQDNGRGDETSGLTQRHERSRAWIQAMSEGLAIPDVSSYFDNDGNVINGLGHRVPSLSFTNLFHAEDFSSTPALQQASSSELIVASEPPGRVSDREATEAVAGGSTRGDVARGEQQDIFQAVHSLTQEIQQLKQRMDIMRLTLRMMMTH